TRDTHQLLQRLSASYYCRISTAPNKIAAATQKVVRQVVTPCNAAKHRANCFRVTRIRTGLENIQSYRTWPFGCVKASPIASHPAGTTCRRRRGSEEVI